jgi:hypothetical protein
MLPANAYTAHKAGYYIWCSVPDKMRSEDIVQRLHAQGVIVSSSSAFSTSNSKIASGLRVALATPSMEQLRVGISRLVCVFRGIPPILERRHSRALQPSEWGSPSYGSAYNASPMRYAQGGKQA